MDNKEVYCREILSNDAKSACVYHHVIVILNIVINESPPSPNLSSSFPILICKLMTSEGPYRRCDSQNLLNNIYPQNLDSRCPRTSMEEDRALG